MSGGRYDGLVGSLCGRDLPAVGISLGADRLFAALAELGQDPSRATPSRVLVVCFNAEGRCDAVRVASELRDAGVATEVYPAPVKLKKQFQYANNLGVPYVAIRGSDEAARGTITLKDMASGEQREVTVAEAIEIVR